MSTTFTVSDDQLADQIIMGSVIGDSHYVWVDPTMQVLTEDGPWPAAQTSWFLEHGAWVPDLYALCDEPRCILPTHLTDNKVRAEAAKEERLMQLVQRQSTTLADLYRKGKARGLIRPTSTYGG